jgi:four helix bundle protein
MYFRSNAQGSASELETELLIAQRLGYLGDENYAGVRSELNSIGRMLVGLSRSIKNKKVD